MFPFRCNSSILEPSSSEEDQEEIHEEEEEDEDEQEILDEYGLGEKEKSSFCSAFTLLDADGDGLISKTTMERIVTGLGRESTPENIEDILKYCAGEKNVGEPEMDFDGFYRYLAEQLVDTDDLSQLENAFQVFDAVSAVDGSVIPGFTDLAVLRHHLKHGGMKLTDEEIDYLWDEENNWQLEEKRIETVHLINKLMDRF